jgi:hypothetical protein
MVGDDMAKWGTGSCDHWKTRDKSSATWWAPAMIDPSRTSEWRCTHVPPVVRVNDQDFAVYIHVRSLSRRFFPYVAVGRGDSVARLYPNLIFSCHSENKLSRSLYMIYYV